MTENTVKTAPMPDPPRHVPPWTFVRRMQAMFIGGVILTATGLSLGIGLPVFFYLLSGRVSPMEDWRLNHHHASATAEFKVATIIPHVHHGSKHPYKVGFRFETADGQSVYAEGFTLDASFGNMQRGDTFPIEYKPDEPTVARPVGGSVALMPLWVYLLIWGLLAPEYLIGLILLFACWRKAKGLRNLLVYGVGVEGSVTHVNRINYIRSGRRNPFDVFYRFTDHRGLTVTGRDRTYHYDWAEQLQLGDKVGVVFNPTFPESSTLWLTAKNSPTET
jgi:hypothetical protein